MPIPEIKRLASWRPGRLAWNTMHAWGWNVARVGFQAATLIILARSFGPTGYGVLAGTVSLYTTLAQIVGLGSGIALVRHLSRSADMSGSLEATQRLYIASAVAVACAAVPLSLAVLGHSLDLLSYWCFAIAEIGVAPLLLPLVYRFQAKEQLFVSGALLTVAPASRFVAALAAFATEMNSIRSFSILYLATLSVATTSGLFIFWNRRRAEYGTSIWQAARRGIPYVISAITSTAGAELDKTILLREAGGRVAGEYAAAYRIVSAAMLPVNSLILAAAPRMFAASQAQGRLLFRNLFLVVLGYSALASGLLLAAAPLASLILGPEFSGSASLLRGLTFVLITGSLRQLINAQLTTSDMQHTRNAVEGAAVIVVVGLLLALVGMLGAWGAILAISITDVLVIITGITSIRLAAFKTEQD